VDVTIGVDIDHQLSSHRREIDGLPSNARVGPDMREWNYPIGNV